MTPYYTPLRYLHPNAHVQHLIQQIIERLLHQMDWIMPLNSLLSFYHHKIMYLFFIMAQNYHPKIDTYQRNPTL